MTSGQACSVGTGSAAHHSGTQGKSPTPTSQPQELVSVSLCADPGPVSPAAATWAGTG